MTTPLSFATWVCTPQEARDARLLVESLRTFGGAHAHAPVQVFTIASEPLRDGPLQALGAEVHQISVAPPLLRAWYGFKTQAAAEAEQRAAETSDILVWMDPDTLFLREPAAFRLPADTTLGYRPVYLRGISSPWHEPLSGLWSLACQILGVPATAFFPMTPVCETTTIRAHIHAGLLVVRPGQGLLRAWGQTFAHLQGNPAWEAACPDERHRIFAHQVALSAQILAMLPREALRELPPTTNLSLTHRTAYRTPPPPLDHCVTLRTEGFFTPGWQDRFPGPAPLEQWIQARLEASDQPASSR